MADPTLASPGVRGFPEPRVTSMVGSQPPAYWLHRAASTEAEAGVPTAARTEASVKGKYGDQQGVLLSTQTAAQNYGGSEESYTVSLQLLCVRLDPIQTANS